MRAWAAECGVGVQVRHPTSWVHVPPQPLAHCGTFSHLLRAPQPQLLPLHSGNYNSAHLIELLGRQVRWPAKCGQLGVCALVGA